MDLNSLLLQVRKKDFFSLEMNRSIFVINDKKESLC